MYLLLIFWFLSVSSVYCAEPRDLSQRKTSRIIFNCLCCVLSSFSWPGISRTGLVLNLKLTFSPSNKSWYGFGFETEVAWKMQILKCYFGDRASRYNNGRWARTSYTRRNPKFIFVKPGHKCLRTYFPNVSIINYASSWITRGESHHKQQSCHQHHLLKIYIYSLMLTGAIQDYFFY